MQTYEVVFQGKRLNKVTFVFKDTGGTAVDKQMAASNVAKILAVRLRAVGIEISEALLRDELLGRQKELRADLTHFETNGAFA